MAMEEQKQEGDGALSAVVDAVPKRKRRRSEASSESVNAEAAMAAKESRSKPSIWHEESPPVYPVDPDDFAVTVQLLTGCPETKARFMKAGAAAGDAGGADRSAAAPAGSPCSSSSSSAIASTTSSAEEYANNVCNMDMGEGLSAFCSAGMSAEDEVRLGEAPSCGMLAPSPSLSSDSVLLGAGGKAPARGIPEPSPSLSSDSVLLDAGEPAYCGFKQGDEHCHFADSVVTSEPCLHSQPALFYHTHDLEPTVVQRFWLLGGLDL